MDNRNQASIEQMMEVTDCTEVTAIEYLTRTGYDVEIAVRHFYEGTLPENIDSDPSPSISSNSLSQTSLPATSENHLTGELIPTRAVLPRYHIFVQFFAQLITLPVKFPLYLINIVYNFLFGTRQIIYAHIFEYISKEFPQFDTKKTDVFYGHQLQNLRSDIQQNHWKWVVAYIHNPSSNNDFLKSLFSSNFAGQVRQRGAVFFGCVTGSDDANRLRPDRSYGKSCKSCVIIFIIRGNSLTRKLIIDDVSNPVTVNANVDIALLDLIADEADREAQERFRNESRQLMEEQNRDYQQSLKQDMERIAKKKSEKEAAEKALVEEKKKQQASELRVKKVQDFKRELIQNDVASEGQHDLLIRFPTGKKVIKFRTEDNIEKLFCEAIKTEICPLFFQMHQNFPRKAVPSLPQWYYDILELEELEPKKECLSQNLTFEEAGITHGSMVYVDNL